MPYKFSLGAWAFVSGMILAGAGLNVRAFAAAPATTAAQPSSASSPKAAVKAFTQAMQRGDVEAARRLTITDNDQQRRFVKMNTLLVASRKRLMDAAEKRFGPEDASKISPLFAKLKESDKVIDLAAVQMDGDTATLSVGDKKEPLSLRRVDGQWKIDLSAMPARQIDVPGTFEAIAKADAQIADGIAAGQFTTAEDAKEALKQRTAQAIAAYRPATRPSSQPIVQRIVGELVKVQGDDLILHLNRERNGSHQLYIHTSPSVDVRLDGDPAALKDLKPGDRITVIFDSAAPMKVVAFSKVP